jgi:hypothetical protein
MAPEARSLKPLAQGEKWDDERVMFWEHENGKAVRKGNWKLTALRNSGWQLFNLENDYSETDNVAAEYPDKVKELKALWNNWAKGVGLSVPSEIEDTEKALVFYYPFNGNINDSSENKYTLKSNGHSFAEGKFGEALSLNGNAQYLDFNTTGTVNTANTQYTVCAWVYDEATAIPTSGNQENGQYFRDQVILAQKDNSGTGRITLYTRIEKPVVDGEVTYFYNNFLGNKQNRASIGSFKRGEWQHIAIVCNPADRSVTYYINGVRDLTVSTNAFEACSGGFRIGGHKNGKDYWTGKIDELYFFRGLLSGDEIRSIRDNTYFSGIKDVENNSFSIIYNASNNVITTSADAQCISMYSIDGKKVKQSNSNMLNVDDVENGIYVVTAVNENGKAISTKISL